VGNGRKLRGKLSGATEKDCRPYKKKDTRKRVLYLKKSQKTTGGWVASLNGPSSQENREKGWEGGKGEIPDNCQANCSQRNPSTVQDSAKRRDDKSSGSVEKKRNSKHTFNAGAQEHAKSTLVIVKKQPATGALQLLQRIKTVALERQATVRESR